jgi:type IV pilus assembly protein PilE
MNLKHPRSSLGFTLIELMVVVVIATILISIAVPSYMSQVRQSRRIEAKTAILDLAGREERYVSTNPAGYTNNAGFLGYTAFWQVVGNGYYQVNVCSPAVNPCFGVAVPNPPAAPSYTIVAKPVAAQSQAGDLQCQQFAVDSTGQQYAADNGGANQTAFCWAN